MHEETEKEWERLRRRRENAKVNAWRWRKSGSKHGMKLGSPRENASVVREESSKHVKKLGKKERENVKGPREENKDIAGRHYTTMLRKYARRRRGKSREQASKPRDKKEDTQERDAISGLAQPKTKGVLQSLIRLCGHYLECVGNTPERFTH